MLTARKILLLAPQPFFQWRGSPIRVRFNILALAGAGCSVDLLTLPVGKGQKIEGVRIIRVGNPFRVQNIPIGPSLHKAVFDLLILAKGVQLVLRNRYDVIHGIEETGIIAIMLSRLSGARAIFEKHSDPGSYRNGFFRNLILTVYRWVETLSVRYADAVICTGKGLVRQARRVGAATPVYHIFDIPSSLVDARAKNIARLRNLLRRGEDEVLLTYVGSFAAYQGLELLLAAIPLVIARCPQARFLIIGGSRSEIADCRQRLREKGVDLAVSFLGKRAPDRLPNYLAASDILLSTRLSGVNTPLKLLDYLKAGRSIVATDVEANRLILNEETAQFAAPDAQALARAMITLIEDGGRRERFGAAGRKLYESRYTFREYARRLAVCYASLPDQTGGDHGSIAR
ncbi:MAG: glycosyltransferase [Desulfobulbaceae bacterium]